MKSHESIRERRALSPSTTLRVFDRELRGRRTEIRGLRLKSKARKDVR